MRVCARIGCGKEFIRAAQARYCCTYCMKRANNEHTRDYQNGVRRERYANDAEYRACLNAYNRESRRRALQQGKQWASRERKTAVLLRLKTMKGCRRCNYRACTSALTFHHRDESSKSFAVNKSSMGQSKAALRIEIRKCDVLCFNCHMEWHHHAAHSDVDYEAWLNEQKPSSNLT